MVTNIDDNLKKLFNKVDELGIKDNTIVMFMTDNGPQHARYVAGMKGRKSSVYNGGIGCHFLRFPLCLVVTKKSIKLLLILTYYLPF